MCVLVHNFPTEAILWIKEVEMVDSVDDLKIFVLCQRNSNAEFWSAKIASALNRITHDTQFKKKGQSGGTQSPKKRTVSFEEDKSLTWSTNTSGSLEPMILSRIMQTYSLLVFEMMIFRNSILNETIFFIIDDTKSHLMTFCKACTIKEYESLRSSRPYWNCTIWRFMRRRLDLIITDWRQW